MAFHRFFRAHIMKKGITVFGDGSQTRDFTFVDDIVAGVMSAGFSPLNSRFTIFNLGSGRRISLKKVIDIIGDITGEPLRISYKPFEKGDMSDTLADISQAVSQLDYKPEVDLVEGLKAEWAWICEHRDTILSENGTC
jgi:UDP-glucuronate 4-epimerase